jgi:hypothetical protein
MNFKTTFSSILTILMVGGVFLSVNQNTSQFEPQAALNESDRVWVDVSAVSSKIDKSGGATCLHYFGGTSPTTFPGTTVNFDVANSKVYLDLIIAQGHTTFLVARGNSTCTAYWGYKTNNISLSGNINTRQVRLTSMDEPDIGDYFEIISHVTEDFSAVNTTSVQNLINTMDGPQESCSLADATIAINTYNAMPTFNQNQFDVHVFSGTSTTGLQRLQYLRSFNNIADSLN